MAKKQWRSLMIGGALLVVAAVLLLPVFIKDWAGDKEKPEEMTIQLIVRTSGGDYWTNVMMGAEAAVKEFGVTMHVSAPEGEADVEGQLAKAMRTLDTNPDAVVLGANEDEAFAPFLAEAEKRGIPVIAIDSLLASGKTAAYVGTDNVAAGQDAAHKLAELLHGEGDVVVMNSGMGGINGRLRAQGIEQALASYSGIRTEELSCAGDAADCRKQVAALLQRQDVNGIITLNTPSSEGAAIALKEHGAGGKVKLVGFDSSPELLELLQEEQIQALVVQNPFTIGYLGVKYAVLAADGERVPERTELARKLIEKDNMFWRENQKLLFPVVQ